MIKNLFAVLVLLSLLLAFNISAAVTPDLTPDMTISTVTSTNALVGTNAITAGSTRGGSGDWWTNSVQVPFTNFTLIAASTAKDCALQFDVN